LNKNLLENKEDLKLTRMLRLTLGSLLSDIKVIVLIFDALQTERKAPYIGSGPQNGIQNFKIKDKIQLMQILELFRSWWNSWWNSWWILPLLMEFCLLSAEKAKLHCVRL
jgi:hypothetical protein